MSSIFNGLYPGSWKGISFLIEESSVAGGRKTVVHEFPNQDNRYVEDLGLLNETISLNVCIPTDAYFSNRDGIKSALESGGYGTLVHPFYGNRQAACTGFTINENTSDLGYVKIAITFSVGQDLNFPATGSANYGSVFSSVENLFSAASTLLTTQFIFDEAFGRSGTSVASSISDIYPYFNDAVSTYILRSEFNSSETADFTSKFNTYKQNTYKYMLDPIAFDADTRSLVESFDGVTSTGSAGFNAASKLFTYDFSSPNKTAITVRQEYANVLRLIVKVYIKSLAFGLCCRNASIYDFSTLDEYNLTRLQIDAQYQSLTAVYRSMLSENTVFNSLTVSGDTADDVMTALDKLRSDTINFLAQSSISLPQLIDVPGREQPLTVLTYSYYGDVEETEFLITLNFPERADPSYLDGTVKILGGTET